MAEQLEQLEIVHLDEALKMEMIINQALMDLLIEKGIITEEEMMAKIKAVKESMGYQASKWWKSFQEARQGLIGQHRMLRWNLAFIVVVIVQKGERQKMVL